MTRAPLLGDVTRAPLLGDVTHAPLLGDVTRAPLLGNVTRAPLLRAPRGRRSRMLFGRRSPILGLLLCLVLSGCIVRHMFGGPHLTGTCTGACAHYIECKPGHPEGDRARCVRECPGVFADSESLMMYESLSCKDAVEYVDGTAPRAASTQR